MTRFPFLPRGTDVIVWRSYHYGPCRDVWTEQGWKPVTADALRSATPTMLFEFHESRAVSAPQSCFDPFTGRLTAFVHERHRR